MAMALVSRGRQRRADPAAGAALTARARANIAIQAARALKTNPATVLWAASPFA